MTERGRELGQVACAIDVLLRPAPQRLHGEAVAKIVETWTMTIARSTYADLA
jgi:hypothetical protein